MSTEQKDILENRQGEVLERSTDAVAAKKLYIESYGCQMNFSDSEVVASIMSENGFSTTRDLEQADVVLINTCSIRENAETRVRKRLTEFKKKKADNPDMVVGILGCMAERLKEKFLEEEKMVEEAMQKHLEDGNNPEDFICAYKPKCLDDCGVVNGDNSSCTDSCGVVNGDGSSCIEPKEESAIVKLFREGGTGFMMCVLICLILGLAICIERIIYLMMASSNSNVLLSKIEAELKNGQIENAKEVCRNTAGPTASICLQGLERSNESVESIEKSIMAYGSVQMGLLEKGTSWISLFIAIAPMLGFMGTVIGMIGAFNSIEAAGDISPSLVAGGIKQALLTTVFGLIVAIILQIFYNFIISKIDDIVNDMEDTSIALVDLIASNKK